MLNLMRKVWDSKAFKVALLITTAPFVMIGAYQPTATFSTGFGILYTGGVLSVNTTNTAPVPSACDAPINAGLAASVTSDALTIALKQFDAATDPSSVAPVAVCFDAAASATSSGPIWSNITTPLSIVIPQNATLGTTNGKPARIWVFLTYNGGTPEMAVAQCSAEVSALPVLYACKSWTAFGKTTTSISSSSNSPGVPYATTGVASDRLKIIGFVEVNESTAGQWATAPGVVSIMGRSTPMPGDVVQVSYAQQSTTQVIAANGQFLPNVAFTMEDSADVTYVEIWENGQIGPALNVQMNIGIYSSLLGGDTGSVLGSIYNSVTAVVITTIHIAGFDLPQSSSVTYKVNADCSTLGQCSLGNNSGTINGEMIVREIMG
jgi:hypothetical protein